MTVKFNLHNYLGFNLSLVLGFLTVYLDENFYYYLKKKLTFLGQGSPFREPF